ncbi:MAG: translesion error-prone DNA polymerase V autoproteolytic subunit [Cyanobacteria bacterium P01_G01_bin.19]
MSVIYPTVVDEIYRTRFGTHCAIPLCSSSISAGFPSPADEYVEGKLDLNQYLIPHPLATFLVRVSGNSMIGAGIHEGDLLVVDRSIEPSDGKVVIAVINGELMVKRLRYKGNRPYLYAENPNYPPVAITEAMEFHIWGVVTSAIHTL